MILLENIASQPMNTFKHTFHCSISEMHNLMTRMNFQEFRKFVQNMSEQEDTWRFWAQIVFQDALANINSCFSFSAL